MAEINIPINADIQELLNKLNLIKQDIDKISASSVEAGNTIKNTFTGTSAAKLNNELERTDGLIEDIEESLKKWEAAKRKATSVDEIEKYNKKIAEGKLNLQEYQKAGLSAIKKVNAEATKGQTIFAGLGNKIAAVFSVYAVINFAKESLTAYNQQLKSELKLKAALGDRQSIYGELIKQSKELQEKTAINDATILSVQSFLAVQGRTEKQITKMTQAATDLSVVLGTDVETAAKMLDQTFEGTIGRLGRYDERLKTLSASQLANGDAVDLLAEKYAGLAEKSATSLDKLQVKWDEFKEFLGEGIYSLIFESGAEKQAKFESDGAAAANGWIEGFKKYFKGAELQAQLKDELLAQKETLSGLQKQLSEYSSIIPKDLDKTYISLNQNIGNIKEKIVQIEEFLAGDSKETVIDYTSKSVEKLNDLLESATEKEKKLIKAELKRRENAEAYNKLYIEGKQKLRQQEIDLMDEGTAKLLAAEQLRYEKEIAEFKQTGQQLLDLQKGALKVHEKKKLDIIDEAAKTRKEKEDKIAKERSDAEIKNRDEQLKKIYDHYKELADAEEKFNEQQEQEAKEQAEKIADIKMEMAQKAVDTINSLFENAIKSQIEKESALNDEKYDNEEKALKSQLDKKKISQEKYDKEIEKLNEQRRKSNYEIALKEHKLNEQLSIAKIAMDAAVAAAKIEGIAAIFASNPATIGFISLPLAQLISIAAAAAAETAIVLSAPKPTFEKGGKLGGNYHINGGTIVEAEKDEWFINRLSSKKYDSVLNAINKDNSFSALQELAKLNGISINKEITNEIHTKEKIVDRQKLSLNEIPEIREIRDLLKREKQQTRQGNGYIIEKIGNIERKIYEA